MNGVVVNADGNSIKVPQERSCSWGAPSYRVLVVLRSIAFLCMENDSDGRALEVLDKLSHDTTPRGCRWLRASICRGCKGRISRKQSRSTLVFL